MDSAEDLLNYAKHTWTRQKEHLVLEKCNCTRNVLFPTCHYQPIGRLIDWLANCSTMWSTWPKLTFLRGLIQVIGLVIPDISVWLIAWLAVTFQSANQWRRAACLLVEDFFIISLAFRCDVPYKTYLMVFFHSCSNPLSPGNSSHPSCHQLFEVHIFYRMKLKDFPCSNYFFRRLIYFSKHFSLNK